MFSVNIMFVLLLVCNDWEVKQFDVSAYCPCEKCCGTYSDGYAANGRKLKIGDKAIAAPKIYKFGTVMCIPGYGTAQVWDRGGAIGVKGQLIKNIKIGNHRVKDQVLTHDRIDLLHNNYIDNKLNHKEALTFGRLKKWYVWIRR